ncbi:MAG: hypothetical protein ACFB12_10240 [Leptolyngbyaceae cyanobacterium]
MAQNAQPHRETDGEASRLPSPEPSSAPRIAPAKQQKGGAEKQVAKFLEQAGLAESVLQGEDFHLRIENEPYIPLVVERHSDQLYLTHYLTQNGDMFIDTEMVLGISEQGRLALQETAVQSLGGEYRGYDRGFAQMFARNINHQGFAEAAQQIQTTVQSEEEISPEVSMSPEIEANEPKVAKGETLFDLGLSQSTALSERDMDIVGSDPTWAIAPETPPETATPGEAEAIAPDVQSDNASVEPRSTQLDESPAIPVKSSPLASLETLREWYRAARDLGRDPEHLQTVKQLGQSAQQSQEQNVEIPQSLQPEMVRDLTEYEPYRQRGVYVAEASQYILSVAGQSQGQDIQFRGETYELEQSAGRLIVRRVNLQPQTILEIAQGKIQRTTVTAEDCQRFQQFVQQLDNTHGQSPTASEIER